MRHISVIITAAAFILNAATSGAAPLASGPSEVGQACSESLGDCAGTLTCIPLSTNCTRWATNWTGKEGCPGTCQDIDISQAQIYTLCGGWSLYDDCDERVERCILDPRTSEWGCGPSCDGPGICWPTTDMCSRETGMKCPEGKECFFWSSVDTESGMCFPLRFGSDLYEKTSLEEVYRTDQDGMQRDP
jgi:hypothetical protein